ncbi:MAG TPA: hypothetical protein QF730_08745 [Planctomycetota bacterium]|nr:hypothetical protein [Planctomycetota bacterium]
MRTTITAAILLSLAPFATGQCDEYTVTKPGTGNKKGFGSSVDIFGGSLAVGFPHRDPGPDGTGEVLLFRFSNGGWELETSLTSTNGYNGNGFGSTLVQASDTLLVGAPGREEVHLFERTGGVWNWSFSASGNQWGAFNDELRGLGESLALAQLDQRNVAVAGGSYGNYGGVEQCGGVAVMRDYGSAWIVDQVLHAPDYDEHDHFGSGVGITPDGSVIAVGARSHGGGIYGFGSVYLFRWDGNAYTFDAKLVPEGIGEHYYYGWRLAMDNNCLAVGSGRQGDLTPFGGVVYVYDLTQPSYPLVQAIEAPDGQRFDSFGVSGLSLDGGRLAVGAEGADGHGLPGATYLFEQTSDGWKPERKLTGKRVGHRHGAWVDLADGLLAVGEPGLDETGVPSDPGLVHVAADLVDTFCLTTRNSSGEAGALILEGSASVSTNDFDLQASACPAERMGVFFASTETGFTPLGAGYLCVGEPQTRLSRLVPIHESGMAQINVDLLGTHGPSQLLTAGTTAYFQFIFNDVVNGQPYTNLTNALAVTICP